MTEVVTGWRQQTGEKFSDIEDIMRRQNRSLEKVHEILYGLRDHIEKREVKVSRWFPINSHNGLIRLFRVINAENNHLLTFHRS